MDSMPINNVPAIGDDQKWKSEIERAIMDLQLKIEVLTKNAAN